MSRAHVILIIKGVVFSDVGEAESVGLPLTLVEETDDAMHVADDDSPLWNYDLQRKMVEGGLQFALLFEY